MKTLRGINVGRDVSWEETICLGLPSCCRGQRSGGRTVGVMGSLWQSDRCLSPTPLLSLLLCLTGL